MKSEDGFTLLESIISISLISLGFILFLHAAAMTAGLHERSRLASAALLAAQEQMELVEARGWEGVAADCAAAGWKVEGVGRVSGEVEKGPFRFRILLEKRAASSLLDRLAVTCFPERRGGGSSRGRSIRIVTLRRAGR